MTCPGMQVQCRRGQDGGCAQTPAHHKGQQDPVLKGAFSPPLGGGESGVGTGARGALETGGMVWGAEGGSRSQQVLSGKVRNRGKG